jgi:hypothetical protein
MPKQAEVLKENQIYKQSYLTLCICLSLHFPIIATQRVSPTEVEFIFEYTAELDALVDTFWKRELTVEPIAFDDQRKNLLRRINETR